MRTVWSGCWLCWHSCFSAGKRFWPDSRVGGGVLSFSHVSHIYSAFLSCLRVSRNRFPFLLIQLETRQAVNGWVCLASYLKFSAISPSNGVSCHLLSLSFGTPAKVSGDFSSSHFLLSYSLFHHFALSAWICKFLLAYPDSLSLFLKLCVALLSF